MGHNAPFYIVSSYVAMFRNVTPTLNEGFMYYLLSLRHFLWQQRTPSILYSHSCSSLSFHFLPSVRVLPFLPCSLHLTLGLSLGPFPSSFMFTTLYGITYLFICTVPTTPYAAVYYFIFQIHLHILSSVILVSEDKDQ